MRFTPSSFHRHAATAAAALAAVLGSAALTDAAAASDRGTLLSPDVTTAVQPAEPRAGGPRARSSIIGGYQAPRGYWPWLAELSLRTAGSDYQRHMCGGTLVSPSVVLTAAHCTHGMTADKIEVAMGRHTLSEAPPERFRVVEIATHASWDPTNLRSDVALLRLDRPSAQQVAPLLNTAIGLQAGWQATALGWGHTSEGGQASDTLKGANMLLVSDADCAASYTGFYAGKHLVPVFDPSTGLCAGNAGGNHNTCQGDSGGPLMVRDTAGVWQLVGAVSWAYGCARAGYPTVFAWLNGPTMRPWIDANIAALAARAAAGVGVGGGGADVAVADVTAPTLRKLRLAPRRFRARKGTTIRFRLSETANVTLVVVKGSGREVTNAIDVRGSAGANAIRYTLRGVRRGRYFLAVRATDDAGNRTGWKFSRFRIKR